MKNSYKLAKNRVCYQVLDVDMDAKEKGTKSVIYNCHSSQQYNLRQKGQKSQP
ncbi:unnamed protein product [Paramecium octaurelia]|uniref:Uncharacterized protein n=1 Tax=Paramecium octaurelia TaxID=43137 RepID=A0A8S1T3W1_PAROT|nr:unnamed protein product [Paramecium octaurelia]